MECELPDVHEVFGIRMSNGTRVPYDPFAPALPPGFVVVDQRTYSPNSYRLAFPDRPLPVVLETQTNELMKGIVEEVFSNVACVEEEESTYFRTAELTGSDYFPIIANTEEQVIGFTSEGHIEYLPDGDFAGFPEHSTTERSFDPLIEKNFSYCYNSAVGIASNPGFLFDVVSGKTRFGVFPSDPVETPSLDKSSLGIGTIDRLEDLPIIFGAIYHMEPRLIPMVKVLAKDAQVTILHDDWGNDVLTQAERRTVQFAENSEGHEQETTEFVAIFVVTDLIVTDVNKIKECLDRFDYVYIIACRFPLIELKAYADRHDIRSYVADFISSSYQKFGVKLFDYRPPLLLVQMFDTYMRLVSSPETDAEYALVSRIFHEEEEFDAVKRFKFS